MNKNSFDVTLSVVVKGKTTGQVVEGPFNVRHVVHPEPFHCNHHMIREVRIRQIAEMHMLHHLVKIMQDPKYGSVDWAYEIVEFSYI